MQIKVAGALIPLCIIDPTDRFCWNLCGNHYSFPSGRRTGSFIWRKSPKVKSSPIIKPPGIRHG
jgi:hypothetical protein